MPKKNFSLEQHQSLGKELYALSQRLDSLGFELEKCYGRKASGFAFSGKQIIDDLRSCMDEHVFQENPERGTNENARVYYCGGSQG